MEKVSVEERNEKKDELDATAVPKDDRHAWRVMHLSICDLDRKSPYEREITSALLSQLKSRANEIRETLMRAKTDTEADRGIPTEWITRRELSSDGYKSVLYKNPVDGITYLFREGDKKGAHITFYKGKPTEIKSVGIQLDGSILVPFKSQLHRDLRNKIVIFSFTSIAPDDGDDDRNGDFVPEPEPLIPGELLVA